MNKSISFILAVCLAMLIVVIVMAAAGLKKEVLTDQNSSTGEGQELMSIPVSIAFPSMLKI